MGRGILKGWPAWRSLLPGALSSMTRSARPLPLWLMWEELGCLS
jgi:hypothetical protein